VGIGINFIGRKVGEEIKKLVQLVFEARKDDNRNALLYNSAGEDSVPLNDERLILVKVDGAGKYAAIAVLAQSQGAKPGEKIFFARDPDAKIVSKVSMLNGGSVTIEADGDIINTTKKNFNYTAEENWNETIRGGKTATIKKDYTLESKKNVNIKSGASAVNEAVQSNRIKGGMDVTLAAPGAAGWCPNCVWVCPWGMPHGGAPGGISGLKGE
jgi:hypothetical protein